MKLFRTIQIPLVVLAIARPSVALACAVCGVKDFEATRVAFLFTTALLSVIPLSFIGGIGYYIHKQNRRPD